MFEFCQTVQFLIYFNDNCFFITDCYAFIFSVFKYSTAKDRRFPAAMSTGILGDSHRFFVDMDNMEIQIQSPREKAALATEECPEGNALRLCFQPSVACQLL